MFTDVTEVSAVLIFTVEKTLKMEATVDCNLNILYVPALVPINNNFCVIQGLELDDKYVSQLKSLFMIISIADIFKWIIIVVGGILAVAGLYLLVQKLTISAVLALGRKSPEVSPRDIETPLRY
jgi:hypothetical protein